MTLKDDPYLTQPDPSLPYFLPKTLIPVGKSVQNSLSKSSSDIPKLFKPLKIKNMEINNRIGVSPMDTYSCAHSGPLTGHVTPFHFAHYASFATRGPGFIIVESTAITPKGRGTPEECGLWNDEQAIKFKEIVDFVHSQGVKIGVQLSHCGRLSSTTAMFNHLVKPIGKEQFGWHYENTGDIVGPSPISYDPNLGFVKPKELNKDEIKEITNEFKNAAKRAVDIAGFDFVEIHAAHGFLLSSFMSGTSNKRIDEYGGSFENRIRFLLEVIDAVKNDKTPLFVRVSGSENADDEEGAWTVNDTVKLSDYLVEHGVDLLDISVGGINRNAKKNRPGPGNLVFMSEAVKSHIGDKLIVSAVSRITTGTLANSILETGSADVILNGRSFLKNPGLVWSWSDELGVELQQARQYGWALYGIQRPKEDHIDNKL